MANLQSKIIVFENKKTSIRLASDEWDAVEYICKHENIKRNQLIELINSSKSPYLTLTSSIRLFSIIYFYSTLQKLQNYDITAIQSSSISEAIHGII